MNTHEWEPLFNHGTQELLHLGRPDESWTRASHIVITKVSCSSAWHIDIQIKLDDKNTIQHSFTETEPAEISGEYSMLDYMRNRAKTLMRDYLKKIIASASSALEALG